MAGNKRIIVGSITQGNLRGKALGDALYNDMCNEHQIDDSAVRKTLSGVKKKAYGKKK